MISATLRRFSRRESGRDVLTASGEAGASSGASQQRLSTISSGPERPVRTDRHAVLYENAVAEAAAASSLRAKSVTLPEGAPAAGLEEEGGMKTPSETFRFGELAAMLDAALKVSRKQHTSLGGGLKALDPAGGEAEEEAGEEAEVPVGVTVEGMEKVAVADANLKTSESFDTPPAVLSAVLSSPKLRYVFRLFLRRKYAVENLLFFEAVELYETIHHETRRANAGKAIVDQFLRDGAEFAVNLGSVERAFLLAASKEDAWTQDIFAPAKREMYHLMNINFFRSFIETVWPDGVLAIDSGGSDPASSITAVLRPTAAAAGSNDASAAVSESDPGAADAAAGTGSAPFDAEAELVQARMEV